MGTVTDIRKRLPEDDLLRCLGAGRDSENEKALFFCFDRRPTDDELRFLHDVMKRAAVLVNTGSKSNG